MNNADIAALVIQELSDRKGFDDWYDQLDEDIQQEIVNAIAGIIRKQLKRLDRGRDSRKERIRSL